MSTFCRKHRKQRPSPALWTVTVLHVNAQHAELHLHMLGAQYVTTRVCCCVCPAAVALVPGPCEPEDLIDGIIFAANYLGCTQVLSDKNPSKSIRMTQAQEAVSHIKVSSSSREGPKPANKMR